MPFWAVTDVRLKRVACEGLEDSEEWEAPKASEEPHSSVLRPFLKEWTCGDTILVAKVPWCGGSL